MDSYTADPTSTENKLADQATDTASGAIRSTQSAAQNVLDRVASGMQGVRDQAAPVIDRVSNQVDDATRRSIEAIRDRSAQVREQAAKASDVTITYIQQEPLKAVLFAAAAGAALMALAGLLGRSRD